MRVFVTGAPGHIGTSTLARKQLGWSPEYPGLLADLDEGHYFATVEASA